MSGDENVSTLDRRRCRLTSFTDLADSTITCHDALQLMICMVSPTCTSPSGGGWTTATCHSLCWRWLLVHKPSETEPQVRPCCVKRCTRECDGLQRVRVVLSFPGGGWDATITLVLGCVGRQGGVEAGLVWVGLGWTGTGLGWTGPTGL